MAYTGTVKLSAGLNKLDPDGTYKLINADDVYYSDELSLKDKIDSLPTDTGGDDNVQSDWNVTDTSSDAYIANKPSVIITASTQASTEVDTDSSYVTMTLYNNLDNRVESLEEGIPYNIINSNTSDTVLPNYINVWSLPIVNNSTITKGAASGTGAQEYIIKFTCATGCTSLTFSWDSEEITWYGGSVPTWTAGKTYEISILDNVAVFLEY